MVILDEESTRALERILDSLVAEHQPVQQGDPMPVARHSIMDQLTLVLEGTGYCQIGRDVHKVQRGALMIIPATTAHSFACDSAEAMRLVHLHAPRDAIDWDRQVLEDESEVLRPHVSKGLSVE